MKQEIKKVKVKAYNRKTHVIEVEYFEMSGHKFCYLKKNGNVILNTTPDQLKKVQEEEPVEEKDVIFFSSQIVAC